MNAVRGRWLMLLGLGLAVLGVVAFIAQLWLQHLRTPWHMPVLALIGASLVAASLWQKRTVWRAVALVLVVLLGGFELMVLYAMRLPAYAGPVAAGRAFPAFEAKLADGRTFTQDDLVGDQDSVLVFFRGRW